MLTALLNKLRGGATGEVDTVRRRPTAKRPPNAKSAGQARVKVYGSVSGSDAPVDVDSDEIQERITRTLE
jgi:hypothetical protein